MQRAIRRQPLFTITTLLGICSIFKSYPAIGDTALYLSLLSLYRHTFPRKSSCGREPTRLTDSLHSDAIYVLRSRCYSLCNIFGTCLLPSMDIRRKWER